GPAGTALPLPVPLSMLSPVLFTLPLQLLAYHVAVLKGTDVDRPRNLAKSVTVE
ncbi:MAG TPA: glucosamine-fructose-6-phosphate aminotransferase, partial [Gammaproteobacteria bacterium]|nr:glucosamine-fructose-6-phosphate aminotransferase [Gammaproteobacteria bacterium]